MHHMRIILGPSELCEDVTKFKKLRVPEKTNT